MLQASSTLRQSSGAITEEEEEQRSGDELCPEGEANEAQFAPPRVRLYDPGIREVLEKVTQNKAAMLRVSKQIFRSARYLYSTPDYGGSPNIYRWNYFYTPVQIGDETVGVRIAVRDVANPQGSQIYHWGIRKEATLDGVGRGIDRSSNGVSSVASSGTALDSGEPGYNPNITGVSSTTPASSISTAGEKVNRGMGTDPKRIEAEAITQILIDDLVKAYRMEAKAKQEKAEAEAITQTLINDWAMKLREEAEANGAHTEAGTSGGLVYDEYGRGKPDGTTDIETDPLQSILHNEKDETLQTNETGARMGKMDKREDIGNDRRKPERTERRKAFLGRSSQGVFEIQEVGRTAFEYRPVAARPPNRNAQAVQKELAVLGIPSFIHENDIEVNRDGKTSLVESPEAVTIGKTIIGINHSVSIPARNTAGHEAFHYWSATPAAQMLFKCLMIMRQQRPHGRL